MLSDLLDGQTISPSGLDPAPASPSVAPETKKEKQTNATSGPSGTAYSASAALQQSLESKLRQQLPTGGLTMFIKDWKQKATPLGRQYCQLAVLARPISETDCGLWPTPSTRDHKDTGNLESSQFRKDGKERNDTLGRVAYGSIAQTESKGSLNPAFPCWLMGYATEWESCADTVTLSSRKSRRSLSKRT